MGLYESGKFFGRSLDEDAVPPPVGNKIPCVAQMLAIPRAKLDAPLVFDVDDLEDFFKDAVLAELRGNILRVPEKPVALGTNPNSGAIFDSWHCVDSFYPRQES